MRIVHLSWEFPPVIYGGLGRHVEALTRAQAAAGHDVVVITQRPTGTAMSQTIDGVRVVRTRRVTPDVRRDLDGLLAWTDELDADMARTVSSDAVAVPDVVHAHDWVVRQAAAAALTHWNAPLVATIHATEAGRHGGWIGGPQSQHIYSNEWKLARSTDRVIACSRAMAHEVECLYDLRPERVVAIPNGIDLARWPSAERAGRPGGQEAPVVFVGRLEWEKGVQVLIQAAGLLRDAHPNTRFVFAGTGTQEQRFREMAEDDNRIEFLGWVADTRIEELLRRAAAVVVPSLYEPFGMVALEAAATGAPLIVSDAGGLAEIIQDGRNGLVVPAGNPQALAAAIGRVVSSPAAAASRAATLRAELAGRYGWPAIEQATADVYRAALTDPRRESGDTSPRKPSGRLLAARS